MKAPIRKVRCAVYTRKSSEEGLDMEFNSLDAKRADLVEAAMEAGDAGFDALIACAFNYEAHTTEFTKLGRIAVHITQLMSEFEIFFRGGVGVEPSHNHRLSVPWGAGIGHGAAGDDGMASRTH